MAPSLSSSFKSVHARAGWGRDLPVQLGLGVPAVTLSSPGLQPRITTLRGQDNQIFTSIHNKWENLQLDHTCITMGDIFLQKTYRPEGQAVWLSADALILLFFPPLSELLCLC